MRRLLVVLAAAGLTTAAFFFGGWLVPDIAHPSIAPATSEPYYGTVNEQRVWGFVQGTRAYQNRPLAGWSETLARCAHRQAVRMAEAHTTFHGTPCPPYTIYQDVGQGPSPYAIYQAFLESSGHRGPILNAHLRALGVGVAHGSGSDDAYYVVLDFAARR